MAPADLLAIARRSLKPPRRTTPDQVIEQLLHLAGLGTWKSNIEFRRAWQRCADLRIELIRSGEGRKAISAEALWGAYDRGLSQHLIAREFGLLQTEISRRTADLGFVLERDPENGQRWRVSVGPCLGCREPLPARELSAARECRACTPLQEVA